MEVVNMHFQPRLIFVGKARSLPLEKSLVRGSNLVGSNLAPNIILGWKEMEVAHTLDYYDTTTIMAVKNTLKLLCKINSWTF
jgi:hypothetical protein